MRTKMESASIDGHNQMGSWFHCYSNLRRIHLLAASELMEMLSPHPKPMKWLELLLGKWRLLYCTGRHIGLTLGQLAHHVLISEVHSIVDKISNPKTTFMFTSDIAFNVIAGQEWPHDKTGTPGNLKVTSPSRLRAGRRQYIKEENSEMSFSKSSTSSAVKILSGRKWKKAFPYKEIPSSLPVAKLAASTNDIELTMNLGEPLTNNVATLKMFDFSEVVCGTYVDSRLLVLRSVNGSAFLFTRSCRGP